MQSMNLRSGSRTVQVTGVLLLLLPALAHSQQIITSPPQNAADIAAFWTAARKSAAKPMPLRSVPGVPVPASADLLRKASGPPIEVPSSPPPVSARSALVPPAVARISGIEPEIGPGSTIWYPYPPPATLSIPVLDYIVAPQFPNTALGKLFFSGPGGTYSCSAQSVTSAGTWGAGNRQTVVTAGHCCSDGAGNWYGNWMLEPAHYNGAAPLGTWLAMSATVYTNWHTGGDLTVDLCVLQMFTLGGRNINDSPTGALGYAANQTLPQAYYATGWPAAAPFSGGLLYYSAASDAETDTQFPGLLPYTHGIGSQMTGGSSGGAWIRKYQSYVGGNNNQFNGLNSYKYTSPNRPAEIFGPYIDSLFVGLLQAVATSPPAP